MTPATAKTTTSTTTSTTTYDLPTYFLDARAAYQTARLSQEMAETALAEARARKGWTNARSDALVRAALAAGDDETLVRIGRLHARLAARYGIDEALDAVQQTHEALATATSRFISNFCARCPQAAEMADTATASPRNLVEFALRLGARRAASAGDRDTRYGVE